MAGFFALNREATSPSEQAMFWGASWCGLAMTMVYAGLIWLAAGVAGSSEVAWRGPVVVLMLAGLLMGIQRYRRSHRLKHVVMQCLLALYPAVAALSAVGAIALQAPQLLLLGSAVMLLFCLLPFMLPQGAASSS